MAVEMCSFLDTRKGPSIFAISSGMRDSWSLLNRLRTERSADFGTTLGVSALRRI